MPGKVQIAKESFTHGQCEPIVGHRHRQKFGEAFSETQIAARVRGQKGKGFLAVIFPYKAGEEQPRIEAWQGDAGVKVSWKGETHYVLLDTKAHEINADGVKGKASCLVLKVKGEKDFCAALPAGGTVSFRGRTARGDGAVGVQVTGGKAQQVTGKRLTAQ